MRSRSLRDGLCAIACVLCAMAPASAQLISPGPLSQAHADEEGDSKCNDCHSQGRRISTSGCVHCHDDLGARVRSRAGLHGREYRDRSCGECHTEHLGRRRQLVHWPSRGRDHFDHRLSGWALEGAHQRVACADCHSRRNRRGARTFLGARTACSSCHEDAHRGRFGSACADCHNATDWNRAQVRDVNHSRTRFPLEGAHAHVECGRCHGDPPRYRGIEFSRCTHCHEDPHRGTLGGRCEQCHSETQWSEMDHIAEHHPGVSLGGGHRRVACARCHDRGLTSAPSRGTRCVNCHRAVHDAPFGRDCRGCHRSIRWTRLPARIGRAAHARTAFPLHGAHAEVDCAGCHDASRRASQRYRGVAHERCDGCHESPHTPPFTAFATQDCAHCHGDSGFAPTSFGVEAHAASGFALEGRHQAVPCAGCHGSERPRVDLHVRDRRCSDCHENPHGEQFATELADGGCAHCHSPAGWHQPRIDHSTWPLTGAHAETDCTGCHTPSDEDRGSGRGASYRGVARDCESCHRDPHAGQFRLTDPVRGCDDCHSTASFELDDFDHRTQADFALEGHHAEAACGDCHPTVRLRGRRARAVRYRLGYRECADCHADPHAPARGRP